MAGGGNLLIETVGERLSPRISYQLIVIPTIILTWLTDINQVISLASRAFAGYYAIECIMGFGLMAIFMASITVFSIPT